MTTRLLLLCLLLLVACLVWRAPSERTLGDGMKLVYLHVSIIWAGMTGVVVSGVLGLLNGFRPHHNRVVLMQQIAAVSMGWFAAGLLLSIMAAKVNWGAVFWQEPRKLMR